MICDLPVDLVEEVLSYLPVKSLRAVRSTCKTLNTLSKSRSFTEKHAKKNEFQVIMALQNRVSLMSVNLISPSIDPIGKLDRVEITEIHHCQGLLLCITKGDELNSSRLLVWNPFLGQTRWIQSTNSYHNGDRYALGGRYALGYDKSLRTHKILRFVDFYDLKLNRQISEFEIYNLNSNSWKVLDVTLDWDIMLIRCGLSLKGNTYWYAHKQIKLDGGSINIPDFLVCFDYTTERFGPHLPLPLNPYDYCVTLSSVVEKQLAVLFKKIRVPANILKIWISDNVEPNAVSWKELFLAIDMKPVVDFGFGDRIGSFFVDENHAMVLYKDMAYIFGKNGCLKRVDFGVSTDQYHPPSVCSYVPSSVQI